MAQPATSTDVHLLVVIHGLWGSAQHVKNIKRAAIREYRERTVNDKGKDTAVTEPELEVLCTKTNEEDFTYDGIDTCGHRVVEEIDEFIAKLAKGNSSTINDGAEEIDGNDSDSATSTPSSSTSTLTTTRTPRRVTKFSIVGYSLGGCIARFAIGVLHARKPESFFKNVQPVNFTTFASPAIGMPLYSTGLSKFLSTLGPIMLSRTGPQLYARDDFHKGKPLLEVISQPCTTFYDALLLFKHKTIFANTVNDRSVPFETGYFPSDNLDPFVHAESLARRHYSFDEPAVDYALGGLIIHRDAKYTYIVESLEYTEPAPVPTGCERSIKERVVAQLPSIPFFMRPKTYKLMPYGLKYLMPLISPLLIPVFLVYLSTRFQLQSRRSRRRFRDRIKASGGSIEAQLRAVGLALDDTLENIAEDDIPFAPIHESAASYPSNGTSEKKLSKQLKPRAKLSQAQQRASANLNAIPDLKKIMVHFDEVNHTHAVIVARDLRFEDHQKGLVVLEYWAKQFEY